MTHVSINVPIHPYCLATYETSRVSPTQYWLWSMTPRHSGCKNSANSSYQDNWNAFKLHWSIKFI